MPKYDGVKIIITKNMADENFIVKWSKEDQLYSLWHQERTHLEWGCYGRDLKSLLDNLELDKQEGYCNDYRVVD